MRSVEEDVQKGGDVDELFIAVDIILDLETVILELRFVDFLSFWNNLLDSDDPATIVISLFVLGVLGRVEFLHDETTNEVLEVGAVWQHCFFRGKIRRLVGEDPTNKSLTKRKGT